ncbi:uncharacterized protein [Drosophila pseudoobscura]|uniref:Uncharacterized protein n=1 Tax=Drosophila pseudoobscura pseudoobscura TaxID=46245 RepID=A0A6I8VQH2_DROPS|nr:uncharacterized protein LOC13036386 [Drosophila pseudoobscura]
MALFKQYHDSKAVLYNFTFEGCKVLDRSTRNPVSNFFMEMLSTYSNLNHSCPYNKDTEFDYCYTKSASRVAKFFFETSNMNQSCPYNTYSSIEFTNVNCTSLDSKFGEFEYCYLKSVNRTYKYFSAKFKVYELPISSMKVNFSLWKRYNGYKPFLYNVTFDACKFFANNNSNRVIKFFYESFTAYSNINHTCPLNHDIIMEKLPIDFVNHRMTEILPFPEGQYLVEVRWIRSGTYLAFGKLYATLS